MNQRILLLFFTCIAIGMPLEGKKKSAAKRACYNSDTEDVLDDHHSIAADSSGSSDEEDPMDGVRFFDNARAESGVHSYRDSDDEDTQTPHASSFNTPAMPDDPHEQFVATLTDMQAATTDPRWIQNIDDYLNTYPAFANTPFYLMGATNIPFMPIEYALLRQHTELLSTLYPYINAERDYLEALRTRVETLRSRGFITANFAQEMIITINLLESNQERLAEMEVNLESESTSDNETPC